MPCVGLQCVIVVFPDPTHLLFSNVEKENTHNCTLKEFSFSQSMHIDMHYSYQTMTYILYGLFTVNSEFFARVLFS